MIKDQNMHVTTGSKKLENYRFTGLHSSHVGALKSALDYLQIPCTLEQLFGLSGQGFIMAVDENIRMPNCGLPEEELFALSQNLGIKVDGIRTYAEGEAFVSLQQEAWTKIRQLIDQGIPVFAKELDLGNEASLIYGYDEDGYYTRSWHDGNEQVQEVIPWDKLGLNYCPCLYCREKGYQQESIRSLRKGEKDSDGGYILVNWVEKSAAKDEQQSFKEMIEFVLAFNQQGTYQWDMATMYSGPKAYEQWIKRLVEESVESFYMGYYAEIWYESRYYGYRFLRSIQNKFEPTLSNRIIKLTEHYDVIQKNYKHLNAMFPWMQPRETLKDRVRVEEAVRLLRKILEQEQYVLEQLSELQKVL